MAKVESSGSKEPQESKPVKSKRRRPILYVSTGCFCLFIAALYVTPADFYVYGYGNVLSEKDAVLRAGSKGPVRAILAQSGDRVTKDQVILELEDDVELAEAERCRRELDHAKAQLAHLEETFVIEKQKDQYQQEIARIQYEDSQAEYLRVKELRVSEATSELELRLATAKRDMDKVVLHERSIDQQAIRAAQIEVQKRRIETLEAQLVSAERLLSRRKVYAPMDGVLVMHTLSIGQVVDANEVLGQIFSDQYYQMVAHIPEQFAYYLKEGHPVWIELSAYPYRTFDYFKGTLHWVSPVVNPQASGDGTVLIKARIDHIPEHAHLKAGMAGRISVQAGKTSLLWRILGIKTYETPANAQ